MFLGTKISYELIKDPHKEVRHVNKAFPRNFELGDGWEVVYLSVCFQTTDYSCSAHSRLLRSLRVMLSFGVLLVRARDYVYAQIVVLGFGKEIKH